MGVTSADIPILETLIKNYQPKSVIELGAQNNYAQPHLPAPYMKSWYEARGLNYNAIDLSQENGAWPIDLGRAAFEGLPNLIAFQNVKFYQRDLVTDFGTSEHVGIDGKFDWEAIYHCWQIKFHLCKIDGVIISENPKTGNWPGHGFQWYTKEFYYRLACYAGLEIILIDQIPAMGNTTDGWNILCVMRKNSNAFPDLETFKTFDLRQS
jgi:hypothetical protein